MRLLRTLPALALLLGARASNYDTRELLDVCAYLDVDLNLPVVNILNIFGHIEACLCVSVLPLYVQSNVVALAAVDVLGENAVIAALTALIDAAAPGAHCSYPPHSKPICDGSNPCGFECGPGFTPFPPGNPKECKCQEPNQICNGQCVPKGACPSQAPHGDRRRWLGSGSCSERGRGWVPCGVFGGGPRAWECINTARDLESCGGCAVPLTAYSPKGKDCTAIPGVADVSCLGGECAVRRCLPGLVPSADGSRCLLKHPKSMQGSDVYEESYDSEFEEARVYGLEHVPLDRQ